MAWTTPATAIAGSLLTASFWNAQVKGNVLLLKTSISDDGDDWLGDVIAASSKQIGYSDGYFARVGANSIKLWNGTSLGTLAVGPLTATTGAFSATLTAAGQLLASSTYGLTVNTNSITAGVRYQATNSYYSFITRTGPSSNIWSVSLLGTGTTAATDAVGTDIFTVSYSGNVGVTGLLTVSGNAATYGLQFDGSNGGGIAATHASGTLRFYSGGTTQRAAFTAAGAFEVAGPLTSVSAAGGVRYQGTSSYYSFITRTGPSSNIWYLSLLGTTATASTDSLGADLLQVRYDGQMTVFGSVIPNSDNSASCGGASNRWTAIYAVNGTIQTSDRQLKHNIGLLAGERELGLDFIMALDPTIFTPNDEPGQRRYGLIAQDVIRAANGRSMLGIVSGLKDGEYGLNYAGFVTPLVSSMQYHEARLCALESKLKRAA